MVDCNTCRLKRQETPPIPYIAYESELMRTEKRFTKLWVVIILLILMLVGTNIAWLCYEAQFENITQEVTQEAETGTNNFIGGDMIGKTDNQNN